MYIFMVGKNKNEIRNNYTLNIFFIIDYCDQYLIYTLNKKTKMGWYNPLYYI